MTILKGLDPNDFIHPHEKACLNTLRGAGVNTVVEKLASVSNRLTLEVKLMGQYLRVSEKDMPELYTMLREVCSVLDYPAVPDIFTCRSEKFQWQIVIRETPAIILTDFVLNDFDEGMLRFHLGCAVTALKARTCHLRMAIDFARPLLLAIPIAGPASYPLLSGWARAAVLSEDRGGLLACQDVNAAYRCLMRMIGIPRKDIDVSTLPDYLAAYAPDSAISGMTQGVQTMVSDRPWNNDRLLELYKWVQSGQYDDLLDQASA